MGKNSDLKKIFDGGVTTWEERQIKARLVDLESRQSKYKTPEEELEEEFNNFIKD